MNNRTQKVLRPNIVMLYFLTDNKSTRLQNMLHFSVCVTFLKIISSLPKCSCVLNCCIKCPGVFVPDAEMNDKDDADLPFIRFHHYKNISSCSFCNQLFLEHGENCTSCTNKDNV